jgi:hypothetical protein
MFFRGNQPQKTRFSLCPGWRWDYEKYVKIAGWIEKGLSGKKRKIVLSHSGQKQLMQK